MPAIPLLFPQARALSAASSSIIWPQSYSSIGGGTSFNSTERKNAADAIVLGGYTVIGMAYIVAAGFLCRIVVRDIRQGANEGEPGRLPYPRAKLLRALVFCAYLLGCFVFLPLILLVLLLRAFVLCVVAPCFGFFKHVVMNGQSAEEGGAATTATATANSNTASTSRHEDHGVSGTQGEEMGVELENMAGRQAPPPYSSKD